MLNKTVFLLSIIAGHSLASRRQYVLPPSEEEYHLRSCGSSCPEGGCKFNRCGVDEAETSGCDGGLCEFIDCVDASCPGGSCVFISSKGSSCSGGACHHVNPKDTLTDGYCSGGGCMLNGEPIRATLRNELTV